MPVQIAKQLADCVIPNEYGIDAGSKMRIGSKICCALLGKLLADLSNMQEESIATAVGLPAPHPGWTRQRIDILYVSKPTGGGVEEKH